MHTQTPIRPPHAWGYCRASTDDQRITNDVQERQITSYFAAKLEAQRIEWGQCFQDEGESSRIPWRQRPEGRRLFELVRLGDHIVVAVHDRPFRSMKEAVNTIDDLSNMGIALHMINLNLDLSDPMGMAMFHVVMAFAQLERGMISKRTKDALAWKRRQGLPTGRRAPIGWRKEGVEREAVLVPDAASRARAYLVVELRDKHRLAWEAVAGQLQSMGVLGETEHYRRKDATGRMTVQTAIKAYRAAKTGFPLANGERKHVFDWEPSLWRQWGIAYCRDQDAA